MQQIIFLTDFDSLIEKEHTPVVWLGIWSISTQHFINFYCVASAFNDLGYPVQYRMDKGSAMIYDQKTREEIWDAAKFSLNLMEERLIARGIEVRNGMFDIEGKGITGSEKI